MAGVTLLRLVQEFSRRRGLPIPISVTGNTNDGVQQIWGLLNEGIAAIADRYEWEYLRYRYTFAHAGSTDYGALDLSEDGPIPGYKSMLNRTLWDTLGRREVYGPFDPKSWETLLNLEVSQAVYNFTISGLYLRIYPVPDPIVDDQFALEYFSNFAVYNPDSAQHTLWFETDTSVTGFPASVVLQDLKWRWNYTKGLPYAEDFRTSEEMIINLQARDPAPDIDMSNEGWDQVAAPGLLVAAGSWNIT
jgi:hypothetical protein